MSNTAVIPDIARCRAGMADLLTQAVAMTRKLERSLNVAGGWPEASARFDLDTDPVASLRIGGGLLLRKARLHTCAVLRANTTSNLHSLAVQMRPALECAGQVVFFFYHTAIAPDLVMSPERAAEVVGTRLNADHYQTLRRLTKGQVSPEELRDMEERAQEAAAVSVGAAKPKRDKKRRLPQEDKVKPLPKGREWYKYLSEHFVHATAADWWGLSWRGGVITMNEVEDELAFIALMEYLVNQVAFMNAAAALCPADGDESNRWQEWVEPALEQLSHIRESSKALVDAARAAVAEGTDGTARTD